MISLFELEYREDVIEYMYEMEVRFSSSCSGKQATLVASPAVT